MIELSRAEITPEHIFLNRRKFMVGAGSAVTLAALAACGKSAAPAPAQPAAPAVSLSELPAVLAHQDPYASAKTDELNDPLNSFQEITNYNNFYEFSMDKEAVNPLSTNFVTRPWEIKVGGLVNKPQTFKIEDILKNFDQEERIYRLRCVEAWSMVIPWVGFPISKLLAEVEPTAEAKYVKFTTLNDTKQFPGELMPVLNWPYVEGLRLDEAMNNLAIFGTGMYGKLLTAPNGAPFRLIVPWKYGFKSIKSIVQIDLVADQPTSTWMDAASNEYGFYANVNPEVDHPRWSQSTERRIGEFGRRETLKFNGYADEVASLYEGMDLKANF